MILSFVVMLTAVGIFFGRRLDHRDRRHRVEGLVLLTTSRYINDRIQMRNAFLTLNRLRTQRVQLHLAASSRGPALLAGEEEEEERAASPQPATRTSASFAAFSTIVRRTLTRGSAAGAAASQSESATGAPPAVRQRPVGVKGGKQEKRGSTEATEAFWRRVKTARGAVLHSVMSYHLWVSWITRYDPFLSRPQRVLLLSSGVLGKMFASAVWFNFNSGDYEQVLPPLVLLSLSPSLPPSLSLFALAAHGMF